jgi:hypothetical protein
MSLRPTQTPADFVALLSAPARASEIAAPEDVYGWLVGSWELDVLHYGDDDLRQKKIKAEAHFGWVLEGRAIQDVWIMPSPSNRISISDGAGNMYGTTLRVWDPNQRAWRIRWIDPISGREDRQVGRRIGDEIVQVGARSDGTPTRWRFTEITANSFRWIGEALEPDGKTWKLEGEFQASRLR